MQFLPNCLAIELQMNAVLTCLVSVREAVTASHTVFGQFVCMFHHVTVSRLSSRYLRVVGSFMWIGCFRTGNEKAKSGFRMLHFSCGVFHILGLFVCPRRIIIISLLCLSLSLISLSLSFHLSSHLFIYLSGFVDYFFMPLCALGHE